DAIVVTLFVDNPRRRHEDSGNAESYKNPPRNLQKGSPSLRALDLTAATSLGVVPSSPRATEREESFTR
ncbi:MAG: hypothetical protein IH940_09260, partial [Acidobacteria bacterium]|nr:hypothetical protein [Acidobacteriota bacterium]